MRSLREFFVVPLRLWGGGEEDFTAETSPVVDLQWQFSEAFKGNRYYCACAIVISILKLDEAD